MMMILIMMVMMMMMMMMVKMMMMMMLMMLMQMMMMIICVWHVTPGRPCHMLPWGARVICYARAGVSHVTLGGEV